MTEQRELLKSILEEQRKTNQILMALVQVLADEQDTQDQEPGAYLDGSPVQ